MVNVTLPIYAFRDEIVASVRENPVTIIVAETGAGKSTQVPQFLLQEGYSMVVTQPRRLAARTVAARVAAEWGEELGETIGFRTAYERKDSERTRCLFCTDGLALVRQLMGTESYQLLVLDEVHEWNLNIEVSLAWAMRQIEENANFRLVIKSATLAAEKLARFCGGAPVIDVPGRLFPVKEQSCGRSELSDVADLLRQGRNVLWFKPGKAEITKAAEDLAEMPDLSAEVLPLHGDMDREDQDRCFRSYHRPKCVIATNVAQTSITIDDIDAVVDSGVERRVELEDGVEGLRIRPISYADAKQRKGRAGRTKPGIYIDWCPSVDRLEFPEAEINRTRLDQTVLRLAMVGINMEELTFFHQPDRERIHEARQALIALGCMNSGGFVTQIGQDVAKLPISVQFGRMVVEAKRRGVVDEVITIAAILEQGGITTHRIKSDDGFPRDALPVWRGEFCPDESESDVLAQLAVYEGALRIEKSGKKNKFRELGILPKAYFQTKERRRHLVDVLKNKIDTFHSTGSREDILKAVCSGMVDHLWKNTWGKYRNGDNKERELARDSVLNYARGAEWLVGLPFDLEVPSRRGGTVVISLVRMATKVDPSWLAEVAPQLMVRKDGERPRYDPNLESVVSTTEYHFNGQLVRSEEVEDPEHPQADEAYVDYLYENAVKPLLPYFDVRNEHSVVPEVLEHVFGKHPQTGEDLKCFGTYQDSWFRAESKWFRTREEADTAHGKLLASFEERHAGARARREELEEAQRRIQANREANDAAARKRAADDLKARQQAVTPDMLRSLQNAFGTRSQKRK